MALEPELVTGDDLPEGCSNAADVIVNIDLQSVIDAIEANAPNFTGDAAPTNLCTPDGDAVFICKLTDVQTGEATFVPHILDPDTAEMTAYSGPTGRCVDPDCFPVDACFEGCFAGTVLLDKLTLDPVGFSYVDADGVLVSSTEPPAAGSFSYGACRLSRMCVRLWLPNADGTFFSCPGPEYTVDLGGDGQPKAWFIAGGLMATADPTVGLVSGTDYVLLPCDAEGGTGAPTEETVVVPYDVNAEADITANVLDGTVTLTDVCSLTVRPEVDIDCAAGLPTVTVTYEDCAGNTVTETVHAGDERCYQCLGSDVTITGTAVVYATTTEQIPIEPNEDCP